MNKKEFFEKMESLPTKLSEKSENQIHEAIKACWDSIKKESATKRIYISSGYSNRTQNYGTTSIYLAWGKETSHYPNTRDYKEGVIRHYQFETTKHGYFKPVSKKGYIAMIEDVKELIPTLKGMNKIRYNNKIENK